MGLCENCKITMCRAERDDVIGCAEFVAKDTNVLTNADRIRAMSDEELAYLIRCGVCELIGATQDHCETNTCVDCVLGWLKQPAEE